MSGIHRRSARLWRSRTGGDTFIIRLTDPNAAPFVSARIGQHLTRLWAWPRRLRALPRTASDPGSAEPAAACGYSISAQDRTCAVTGAALVTIVSLTRVVLVSKGPTCTSTSPAWPKLRSSASRVHSASRPGGMVTSDIRSTDAWSSATAKLTSWVSTEGPRKWWLITHARNAIASAPSTPPTIQVARRERRGSEAGPYRSARRAGAGVAPAAEPLEEGSAVGRGEPDAPCTAAFLTLVGARCVAVPF